MQISVTPAEKKAGALGAEALEKAVAAFRDDGYVVLLDAVDRGQLDALGAKMLEDVAPITRQAQPPYQFVDGHIQHDPPPLEPYLLRDIYYNEAVVQVAHRVLGDGLKAVGVTGNTNLPGSLEQPVHVDSGHLWSGLGQPHPTCDLVVNISPGEVGPHNGATELWPGSHLDDAVKRGDPSIVVPRRRLEARRAVSPPVQLELPQGAALLRDMRLWHRGVPNRSDTPRPMVALILACRWMRGGRLRVPAGQEGFFSHETLDIPVEGVEGDIDYLGRHKPYDYTPRDGAATGR